MFAALAFAVALFPAPWSPEAGVSLADAQAFHVAPITARVNWRLACNHMADRRAEVWAWNLPEVAEAWERECEWRRACWDDLDTALFHPACVEGKLAALARLRRLLGDEAYMSGAMPSPIPSYRTLPR